ncbi:MAG: protein phosphatase 2C domain-containing protein [Capsulimonadales bacterium]|nr:protein phosphatase 2C domain-containing protein [Capsulimonadales bacterium]
MSALSDPPRTNLRTLFAPKDGNTEAQYEDASACTPTDLPVFTVAVADGASSAVYARDWAQRLVGHFTEHPFPVGDADVWRAVALEGAAWLRSVEERATTWHAQEKIENGSEATLLVVTFDRERLLWEARSIGDNCVFLVRRNKLRYAFPLTKSTKFDDRPPLVSTRAGQMRKLPPVVRYSEKFESGDRFLFMTDALASWFLAEFEAKRKPWNQLPETPEAFRTFLKTERDAGRLKNDDVTLIDLLV